MGVRPSSARPRQLSGAGIVPAVRGVLDVPGEAGPHPGVILLVGSAGWHARFAEITRPLAEAGFAALLLDYLAETGLEPSPEETRRHLPLWQAMLRNAVTWLGGSPFASGRPVGLIGYSLGAFLALSTAATLPGVRAVVDFFGWMGPPGEEVRGLPPLLILHGEADSVVPVSEAYRLRDAVIAQGGHAEMHLYPAAEHAFNAPWGPRYSEPEAMDSLRRTIEFLSRQLGR